MRFQREICAPHSPWASRIIQTFPKRRSFRLATRWTSSHLSVDEGRHISDCDAAAGPNLETQGRARSFCPDHGLPACRTCQPHETGSSVGGEKGDRGCQHLCESNAICRERRLESLSARPSPRQIALQGGECRCEIGRASCRERV